MGEIAWFPAAAMSKVAVGGSNRCPGVEASDCRSGDSARTNSHFWLFVHAYPRSSTVVMGGYMSIECTDSRPEAPTAGHQRPRRTASRSRRDQRRASASRGSLKHLPAGDSPPPRASAGSWSRGYVRRLVAIDLLIGGTSSLLAATVGPAAQDKAAYFWASILVALGWPLLMAMVRGYDRRYVAVSAVEYTAVGRATALLLGIVGLVAIFGNILVSRSFVLLLLALLPTLGIASRRLARLALHSARRRGQHMQRTLVVGRPEAAEPLIRNLMECPDQGLAPVACYTPGDAEEGCVNLGGLPVIGPSENISDIIDQTAAEVVVVAGSEDATGVELRRLGWALEEREVDLLVSTGVLDVAGPRLTIRPSEHFSLLHIERPAATRAHLIYKDVIDRAMALILLVLLAPVLLVVAAAIRVTSRGPALYRQMRIGERGEPFRIYKFRTMVVGADRMLDSMRHLSEGNEVQFKMKRDPRVTRVGALLRRTSLDELPQLFNVLRGEMSLVGPRPQSQAEVDMYEPDAMRRLHVRPGMTGLWQISGRSDLTWEQSLRLDLRYVDNWSPIVDLTILARTLTAVVKGAGAY